MGAAMLHELHKGAHCIRRSGVGQVSPFALMQSGVQGLWCRSALSAVVCICHVRESAAPVSPETALWPCLGAKPAGPA